MADMGPEYDRWFAFTVNASNVAAGLIFRKEVRRSRKREFKRRSVIKITGTPSRG